MTEPKPTPNDRQIRSSLMEAKAMADLLPQARAVLDAFVGDPNERDELEDDRRYLAAALRAAADQVVPEEESCEGGFSDSLEHQCRASERRLARAELLAIATELEGSND